MLQPAVSTVNFAEPVIFMPGVFNETLNLLFESHQYFEHYGEEEQLRLPNHYRMAYTGEMSRITMRLTSVMAWLMVRKAVNNGKIDAIVAAEKYRLDAPDIGLSDVPDEVANLPFLISDIAQRSRELYERVWRLDNMAYESSMQ